MEVLLPGRDVARICRKEVAQCVNRGLISCGRVRLQNGAEGHAEGTTCGDSETCQRFEARKAAEAVAEGCAEGLKGFLRPWD